LVLLCTEETGDYQYGSIPQLNPEKFANAIIAHIRETLWEYNDWAEQNPTLTPTDIIVQIDNQICTDFDIDWENE